MSEMILLVDDSVDSVAILTHCLVAAGYQVTVAENGEQALEQIGQSKPDLILLDVMMPGIDGYETCRQFKARSDTRQIPVLFASALEAYTSRMQGFEAGGVDYITKPYNPGEVVARVRTHLTLRRQQRELELMLAQRNQFMRTAAHDLRNPLLGVLAFSELGMRDSSEGRFDTANRYFSVVFEAARRMKDIIDVFLSLQVQSRNRPAEKFNLGEVVDQVVALNGAIAVAKKISLCQRLPADLLPVFGDLTFTHQIVSNFVSNAIKFSPLDSIIQLTAGMAGNMVRLEVKDQGPGVPEADRNRLFVEFAQIAVKATAGESSTGLGLAIVKYLAEIQGGKAGANFPPEGGSVFWFEIPSCRWP